MDNENQKPTTPAPREKQPTAPSDTPQDAQPNAQPEEKPTIAPATPKLQSATTTDAQPNESPTATLKPLSVSKVLPSSIKETNEAWLVISGALSLFVIPNSIPGLEILILFIAFPSVIALFVSNAYVGAYLAKKAFLRNGDILTSLVWLLIGQVVILALSLLIEMIFGGFELCFVNTCRSIGLLGAALYGIVAILLMSIPAFCAIIVTWTKIQNALERDRLSPKKSPQKSQATPTQKKSPISLFTTVVIALLLLFAAWLLYVMFAK